MKTLDVISLIWFFGVSIVGIGQINGFDSMLWFIFFGVFTGGCAIVFGLPIIEIMEGTDFYFTLLAWGPAFSYFFIRSVFR